MTIITKGSAVSTTTATIVIRTETPLPAGSVVQVRKTIDGGEETVVGLATLTANPGNVDYTYANATVELDGSVVAFKAYVIKDGSAKASSAEYPITGVSVLVVRAFFEQDIVANFISVGPALDYVSQPTAQDPTLGDYIGREISISIENTETNGYAPPVIVTMPKAPENYVQTGPWVEYTAGPFVSYYALPQTHVPFVSVEPGVTKYFKAVFLPDISTSVRYPFILTFPDPDVATFSYNLPYKL